MSPTCRTLLLATVAAAAAVPALTGSTAYADGIEAGLWKITNVVEQAGMVSPPRVSQKCLTAADVADPAVTFTPRATTINSECQPIEHTFDGTHLKWHLVCQGQLNMDLTGEFTFDTPHHYTGMVQTKASMAGQPMPESKNGVEGEWVSACPQ